MESVVTCMVSLGVPALPKSVVTHLTWPVLPERDFPSHVWGGSQCLRLPDTQPRFAVVCGCLLDLAYGPAQLPQPNDMVLVFFVQDTAHLHGRECRSRIQCPDLRSST